MAIELGENASPADFINDSEKAVVAANDNGRVPKLEQVRGTDRKLSGEWHRAPVITVFASGGTYTKSAKISHVVVEVVGGGGGGAGCSSDNKGSSGGGGGGYSRKIIVASALNTTESVVVGAGGAAGTSGGGDGGAGGTSSFGSHCSATGGAGGTTSAGGAGGAGADGDINLPGDDGGKVDNGYSGSEDSNRRGFGGGNYLSGIKQSGAGKLYGGGGSGVDTPNGGSAQAGFAGAAGVVIVTEFY